MKPSLAPGLNFEYAFEVPVNKTVPYLFPEIEEGGRMPEVFATGFMVGLIEFACIRAINPHLDWPREQSVGIRIDVSHTAATPPGLTVTVRGTLERMEGRRLFFSVSAHDGIDQISEGTHERFVIDAAKFNTQVAEKAARAAGRTRDGQLKGENAPMQDKTVSEVIETAIRREEESYRFYMDIHAKVVDPGTRDILEFVAGEEQKHRAFLVDYRDGKFGAQALRHSEVVAYQIAEHLDEPEAGESIKPEDVFLVAAHRESRSNRFYAELAMLHPAGELRDMLLKMANEELKHKEKMEYLYANTAFPQTSGG